MLSSGPFKQPLEIGKEICGLYLVDHQLCNYSLASSSTLPSQSRNKSAFSCQMSPLELWHCRLGHMSFHYMKHIDVVSSCKSSPCFVCEVCHHAKRHRIPFPDSTSCISHIF